MELMFSRAVLAALPPAERPARLALLADRIGGQLAGIAERDAFRRETERVVAELRRLGHALWSHGVDGEARWTWGWDERVAPPANGTLWVQFTFGGPTRTAWVVVSPGPDAPLSNEV